MTPADLESRLVELADPAIASQSARFFKTGPGEYGAGDRFRGIRVPALRALVKPARTLSTSDCAHLLHSPWHEDRLLALLLLVDRFRRGKLDERAAIHHVYLDNTRYINNWDLVDCSAEHIVGAYLTGPARECLDALAASPSLWERRIAIMATFHYIKQGDFGTTLRLAERLLDDRQDLIHKAVGWMLREVGKRAPDLARDFLEHHGRAMPRTMLRYAIERLPAAERRAYLAR